jgi:hypothetical protein
MINDSRICDPLCLESDRFLISVPLFWRPVLRLFRTSLSRHAGHHLISDLAWRVKHPREFRWVYRATEPISRQLARSLEGIRRETPDNSVGRYWLITDRRIPLSVQQEKQSRNSLGTNRIQGLKLEPRLNKFRPRLNRNRAGSFDILRRLSFLIRMNSYSRYTGNRQPTGFIQINAVSRVQKYMNQMGL